ncbi:MAG: MFS transporter [Phycisphaerales bacterium]|jgi:MFS family permease
MRHAAHPRTLVDWVTGWLLSFHPRHVQPMQRANYLRELVSWAFLPVMLGAIEGGTMSVIVKKAWADVPGVSPGMLDLAVAFVSAAPNFANLTSFLWARVSAGRDKVAFISRIQLATCACVALVAAMPVNAWGLVGTCVLVLAARSTWTGVITVRAAIWRQNYPKANRASIAGKMATVQSLMLALAGWVVGATMDLSPSSFHWVFPLLAAVGVYGNSIFRGVRLRGGRRLAERERAETGTARVSANPARTAAMAGDALRTNWRVLVVDREYRTFMTWMFVFGLGNLMIGAPQAIFLEDTLGASYLQAILATTVIPLLAMPLAIPVWARLLDRVHIVRFRSIHGWAFVAAAGMMWLAASTEQLWLFYVAGALMGVGFAGGSIAWNIGHQDFSTPEQDALYMSVHVTLNGIRGVIAPFAAVGLYVWLGTLGVPSLTFAVCFAVNVVGVLGFAWQWRGMRARMEGFDRGAKTASIDASIDEDEPLGRIRASIDRGD